MILVAGDLSWDTTLFVPGLPGPDEKVVASGVMEDAGGVGANAAVAAARAGVAVRFLGRAGLDPASRAAAAALQSAGVEAVLAVSNGALSRAVTLVDPAGEKWLVLAPGASMFPTAAQAGGVALDGVAWVHIAPYEAGAACVLARRCWTAGIPWSVDLEPAVFSGGLGPLSGVLDGAATVFCNDRAAVQLGADPEAALARLGVRTVVRTHGAGGAVLHGRQGSMRVHAPAGPVVDTTGAGDCLAGWYIARCVAGDAPGEALRRAVRAATFSCGRPGAQSAFPSLADMMAAA